MTTLGVLADTHVPDRVPELNPRIFHIFREAGVTAILHAGDVIIPRVLDELEQIAPVYAVRGNRDIFYLRKLPLRIELNFEGIKIGLGHGHHSFSRYVVDKIHRAMYGWSAERYIKRLLQGFPGADVIVFGHIHFPYNMHLDGKLLFNPGSTSLPWPRNASPTIGLLHLERNQEPRGEIIEIP